jgi:acyl-coenzyme A thioesterase PaaI-like protein
MHFLSPGRVGPIVAVGELVGSRGGDHLVRVSVRDRGADDRLLTLAALTVRTV